MLELIFCNVGDGDACIVREKREGQRDYILLMDAGRPALDYEPGSHRREIIYHLRNFGIDHIDLCVLTHLHVDHVGGMDNLLRHYPIGAIMTPYIPPVDADMIDPPYEGGVKKLIGAAHMLNIWNDTINLARSKGVKLITLEAGKVALTPSLTMETEYPVEKARHESQHKVFDNLFHGIPNDYDEWYAASNDRNILGPLTLLTYAGRRILFAADVYAVEWENTEFAPCDILKLPHHGDPKSMTKYLIGRLHPRYAIASCQNDPNQKKDRPNAEIVRMVQEEGAEVICTENKPLPTLAPVTHWDVRFEIGEDGKIENFIDF